MRVDQIVREVLGDKRGGWNDSTRLVSKAELSSNPAVKYPRIPVMFGNSYVGLFDTEAAREATRRLFAEYGLELEPGVRLKGEGFDFVADGYDEEKKVGFKLVEGDGARIRFADQKVVKAPPKQTLEDVELPALDKAVQAGEVRVFVAQAGGVPNMDNDLYTPMQYYLASVVDYLNWVHGDRQIDPARVLGDVPGGDVNGVIRAVTDGDGGGPRATLSIGRADGVIKGMRFHVTDPESRKYLGVVVVDEVEDDKATGPLEGTTADSVRPGHRVATSFR
jgi:hypothetical protein